MPDDRAAAPEELDVPVAGGTLRVVRWAGRGPVLLAVHGITANALSFAALARELAGRCTLVAPDLRGRAGSRDLPPPYGVSQHAEDIVAVLDHLGLPTASVLGHSMGGFVATVTATRHPDRVASVLLVDGGVSLPVPPDSDIDAMLHAVIGPAMQRLQMTFPTPAAYLDFWRAHPALAGDWTPDVESYLLRDLVGVEPELRSSCSLDAVRADGTDILRNPVVIGAVHELTCPATLLWAERGLLNEPRGLYDDERLSAAGVDPGRLASHPVEGVNHYTLVVSARGARCIADHLPL